MTTFAVRAKILKEFLQNPEFATKWSKCISIKDCQDLIVEWCKKKGYAVKELTEKRYERFCSVCHGVTFDFYCCGERTRRVNLQHTLSDCLKAKT